MFFYSLPQNMETIMDPVIGAARLRAGIQIVVRGHKTPDYGVPCLLGACAGVLHHPICPSCTGE